MTEFPQFNEKHQTTEPRSSENVKQKKYPQTIPKHIFKLRKIKDRKKSSKKPRGRGKGNPYL